MSTRRHRSATTRQARQEAQEVYERLNRLAYLLDERFSIPGTNWRFGLDAIIGLVPGFGDLVTSAISAYIVLEARRLGISRVMLLRMSWNVILDTLLGSIPLAGDVFDAGWKANRRNVRLLMQHIERRTGRDAAHAMLQRSPRRRNQV